MLPQNKISGLNIAWGRGKWAELEDGSFGYIFPEDDAFSIRVNPGTMEELGVSEDDLYDCIAQIEAEYGAPKDHRLSFGLLPNQGYSKLGITVRSSLNDRVMCVFTPTSIEDGSYDGYFEWYYDNYAGGFDNLADYLVRFDKATDSQSANVVVSPIMPTYGEASEKTRLVLDEHSRENFLRQVWNFHKTSSRGYRHRLETELLPQWKDICEVYDEKSVLQGYKNDLASLTDENLKGVIADLKDIMDNMRDVRPDDDPEFMKNQKRVQDQLDLAQDELAKRRPVNYKASFAEFYRR